MEVTLLIEAAESAFRIMQDARIHAIGILDSTIELMSEERRWLEEKRIKELFTGAASKRTKFQNFLGTWIILFGFWVILSGNFDRFHLSAGIICSLVASYMFHGLLFSNVRIGDIKVIAWRFILYIPWLIKQIVMANIHVASLVLNPSLPIDPKIIKFKTRLETDISNVTLANSITLTPGTITVDIRDGEFYVHALSKKVAEDLNEGEMEDRVAHIFMEADHFYIQDALDATLIYEIFKT